MVFKKVNAWLGMGLALVLALANLTVLESNVSPAQALSGSQFDPGLIISDNVFNDFGTMTVDEIQNFLNTQVKKCTDNDGGPKCLRNYTENVVGSVAIKSALHSYSLSVCKTVPAAANQTAAQIIFSVAQACGINPRVFLVTLQKEQGLVQAANPTTYMYKAAMGYGCPDSNPSICGADSNVQSRLFWQLYRAGWQLKWYGDPRGSFTYLKPGKTISVLYNPTTTCGRKSFTLSSKATAKLYYYTPYTPNQAALNNLFGTGDSCSAYGNRNFWRWYSKWFGSPVGGGFILRSATSESYLVTDTKKYRLSSPSLLGTFEPLGAGMVSQAYLDSIPDGPALTRLISDPAKNLYFVDRGVRYPLADCNAAINIGYQCDSAAALTQDQVNLLPLGAATTALVAEDPARADSSKYLISNGYKREILNDSAVAAENLTLPALSPVPLDAFDYLPWGRPVAIANSLFTNRSNGQVSMIFEDKVFQFDKKLTSETNFAQWIPSTPGTLSGNGLSSYGAALPINALVKDSAQRYFLLTSTGKSAVNNGTEATPNVPSVPDAILNLIPTITGVLETPGLVSSDGNNSVYLIKEAALRQINPSDIAIVSSSFAVPSTVQAIPQSALTQLKTSANVFAAGSLLRDEAQRLWLVNGSAGIVSVPSDAQAALFGLGAASAVNAAQLAGYQNNGSLSSIKVVCGSKQYLGVQGSLQPIAAGYAAHYPGAAVTLNADTCRTLKLGSTQLGRFVKVGSKTYLLENGKRRWVRSTSQYKALRGKTPAAYTASSALYSKLPLGKTLPTSTRKALKRYY